MRKYVRNKAVLGVIAALIVLSTLLSACSGSSSKTEAQETESAAPAGGGGHSMFTLQTALDDDGLAFIGVGGDIDGVRNPDLKVAEGDTVEVTLQNAEGSLHNLSFPDFNAATQDTSGVGSTATVSFTAGKAGEVEYYCTLPGHKAAGMLGKLTVGSGSTTAPATGADVTRLPDDIPAPVGDRAPQHVRVDLETVEVEGQLADGATFNYWTFNGTVPGPMVRVRVGDDVELHLKNNASNVNTHSIDLHAVTGPGGGATVTQVGPGEERSFTFKALSPGLYVYHCATPSVAHHISSGMYGMILVEPEGGLPPVDHEYYVMQGEIYTMGAFGAPGHQETSMARLIAEHPRYVVMNGSVGALTDKHPLTANVGETVRIYYGVGGPNLISSFHIIGEIFDRVWNQASLTTEPMTDVQTTLVPPGGATMVEFKVEYPGRYLLVDHALGRLEQGNVGYLIVSGEADPNIFNAPDGTTPGGGH